MNLSRIIKGVEVERVNGSTSVEVSGLSYDSTKVLAGFCFVAVRGSKTNGHDFIPDAIKRGVKAIVSEQNVDVPKGVTNVIVKDSRLALALISSNYFGEPSKDMRVIGVTGTNGKTTISYLIESIFKRQGRKVGVIGTVSWRYNNQELPAPNTTPMSYDLQLLLSQMKRNGVTDVVMEVSSHALDQHRAAGVNFDSVIFTNLTHDHLDYHVTVEEYFKAKKRLFSELLPKSCKAKKSMSVNIDDEYGMEVAGTPAEKGTTLVTYGFKSDAGVSIRSLDSTIEGNWMDLSTPWGDIQIKSHLRGKFNASNVMAAVASLGALGVSLEDIKNGIETLRFVPGRLEDVPNNKGVHVFVDYAHTPDALKNTIETLKAVTTGRLITIFGCGGDRDRTKRPVMGEIAAKLSDVVVVTSDNPRTEDPGKIMEEIVAGAKPKAKSLLVEMDRTLAIEKTLRDAKEGDVVLIAGKGHETYQIIGKEVKHFDDREVAKKCL